MDQNRRRNPKIRLKSHQQAVNVTGGEKLGDEDDEGGEKEIPFGLSFMYMTFERFQIACSFFLADIQRDIPKSKKQIIIKTKEEKVDQEKIHQEQTRVID